MDWTRAAEPLMAAFSIAFTQPTFQRVMVLILGAIMSMRPRTVTGLLRAAGGLAKGHWSDYHRVLSLRVWSNWPLGRVLASLILELVPPDQPVVIPVDDTNPQHKGPHVYGKGRHHDAIRSTHSHIVWVWGHFGWSGVLRGSAVIFFAYIGFDAVSTAAQEAKNPQRDMPIGILGSLGISTILYILVAIVLTGIVSYTFLNVADPIAVGVDAMGKGLFWLRPIIKIAAIAGLSSVILVMMLGQPRIFYAMAKDGLLPSRFARIHPRFKTPYYSTIVTGSIALIFAGILPINILGELVSIGTLLAFAIVCIGIIFLRVKRPELKRPFRTPLVPLVPILGALICMIQMYSLPLDTWLRLIIWMAIGFVIYFTYGIRHSVLRNEKSQGLDEV